MKHKNLKETLQNSEGEMVKLGKNQIGQIHYTSHTDSLHFSPLIIHEEKTEETYHEGDRNVILIIIKLGECLL